MRSLLDFVSRLAFFALAPFVIVRLAWLFPVHGAIVSVAMASIVFVAAHRLRAWSERSRLLRLVIGRELRIEEHYRSHPPKPFAYYVFYPLLFPYWLIHGPARREFWLFKGYTLVSVVILLVSSTVSYFVSFRPELGLSAFLPVIGVTLAWEALLVLALLMPIATTVVTYMQREWKPQLVVLVLVGGASTSASLIRHLARREPIVSYATRERTVARSKVHAKQAHDVQLAALRAAWWQLRREKVPIEGDGRVEGLPLDTARKVLEEYYKEDEAWSFDIWASPRHDPKVMVLYFEGRSWRRPIWIAIDGKTTEIKDPKRLPKGAFAAMHLAADQ